MRIEMNMVRFITVVALVFVSDNSLAHRKVALQCNMGKFRSLP
jgi:hypothetical protein